jgi:hypothetical protein
MPTVDVKYLCKPDKDSVTRAELAGTSFARLIIDKSKVQWRAVFKIEQHGVEIALFVSGRGFSKEKQILEILDFAHIVKVAQGLGKTVSARRLEEAMNADGDVSNCSGIIEHILDGALTITFISMRLSDSSVEAQFELDVNKAPEFQSSFSIAC